MHARRIFVAMAACFAFTGCRSSDEVAAGAQPIRLLDVKSAATISPGWLNPKTLQLHTATELPEADDLILRGTLTGWYFEPTGEIEGAINEPPPISKVEPCWLHLATRSIHPMDGREAPPAPYLPGRYDKETGLFYPSQRTVIRRDAATEPVPEGS
jgi:hypothetical protein